MKKTLHIVERLLREARSVSGAETGTDTVRLGLESLVRHAAYQRLIYEAWESNDRAAAVRSWSQGQGRLLLRIHRKRRLRFKFGRGESTNPHRSLEDVLASFSAVSIRALNS